MHHKRWVARVLMIALIATAALPVAAGSVFVISDDPSLTEIVPSVTHNSTDNNFLVVWFNDRPGNDDIRAQRVTNNGSLQGPAFYVSAGAGADRRYPDVAYNATDNEYLVVWEHQDALFGRGIHGRRISGSGAVLDATDIVIQTPGGAVYSSHRPAVAYSSTDNSYLVVWSEVIQSVPLSYAIFGRVVSASGVPDGGPEIPILAGNIERHNPDVAYNRRLNEYLAVWQEYHWGHIAYDIYARRLTAGGVLLGSDFEIHYSGENDPSINPAVASMPPFGAQGQYLAVHGFDGTQVLGRFVSGDGTPDPYEVQFGTDYYDSNPAIAGQEATQSYLVSWSRPADPPLAYKYIYAQTVSSSGDFRGNEWFVGGFFARNSAVAAAAEPGIFLIVFDDIDLGAATRGIYGASWDYLFADGFEYGSTSAWSSSVP
jgi:hypothetical protein